MLKNLLCAAATGSLLFTTGALADNTAPTATSPTGEHGASENQMRTGEPGAPLAAPGSPGASDGTATGDRGTGLPETEPSPSGTAAESDRSGTMTGDATREGRGSDSADTPADAAGAEGSSQVAATSESETIEFDAGSTELSADKQQKLRESMAGISEQEEGRRIIVAVWPDREVTAQQDLEQLGDSDAELAQERADNIRNLLEEVGADDVQVVNMGERSGWFARTMGTQEAQLKQALQGEQVDDADTQEIANLLRENGGASKAVVVVHRDTNN